MSIWATFTNSGEAIQTQSNALAVISQNISNINTTGYKAVDNHFQTLLSDQQDGTNIFSVQGLQENENDVEGSFQTTNLWDNLAINGPGFFVLNTSLSGTGNTLYTRAGDFGEAVNSTDVVNGQPATAAGSIAYLTGSDGGYLMGWQAVDGVANTSNSLTSLTPVGIALGSTIPGKATSAVALQGSIPSNPTDGVANTAVPVYDNSFNTQSLQMTFTQTGENQWSVAYSLPTGVGTVPTGSTTDLTFDGSGNFVSQTGTASVPITWADGTTSNVSVDFSKMSQLASGSLIVNAQTQNGYGAGTLVQGQFDSNGNLYGDYSNGQKVLLYTLPVASFTAPDSLQSTSGTNFTQTAAAGSLNLDPATSLNDTSFIPGTVESSNVDLGTEFSQLIQTQTAYNSATKIFNVSDQMAQTLRDLVT